MTLIQRKKPVADQVYDLIRERITNHTYAVDEKLPSEENLAEELEVSRATVRTALAALAAESLVTRRQGDGTYVNRQVIELKSHHEGIWDFYDLIESSGRKASIRVIRVERRPASRKEADALQITTREEVVVFERLFLGDEQPLIHSINVIPSHILCKKYPPESVKQPIIEFLKHYCKYEYTDAVADISATSGDDTISEIFGVDLNKPLLQFDEIFYGYKNTPLVFATNYYNDQVLRLRLLKP